MSALYFVCIERKQLFFSAASLLSYLSESKHCDMCLIHKQVDVGLFEVKELEEIQIMADYVALFYGREFLEAPLLADAGLNDLEAWQFMEMYREHQPVLAKGVLDNMSLHLDYLSEENVFPRLSQS